MQFYDFDHDVFQNAVVEAVKDGSIKKDKFDRAVTAVLRIKFELGLFENPYTDETLISKVFHSEAHQALALESGRKSIVLLKNDNNTLPLSKNIKRIALIGNLANISSVGGYSPRGARATTVYEALTERFGKDIIIDYVQTGVSNMFTTVSSAYLSNPVRPIQAGVYAEYFNNTELSGKPAYTSIEENLQGYWHNLSPAPGINPDNFSIRYSGYLTAPVSGIYEFGLSADDRARLYLNNDLILNNWENQNARRGRNARITLNKGQKVPVRLEYAEIDENASVQVRWRLLEITNTADYMNSITRAVASSDAAIVVLGETSQEVGEGHDRQNLNLKPMDIEILEAAAKGKKPVVSVMLTGRPLVLTPVAENSSAVLEAWFPGERGGHAIVDVLFGDYNPSGRLTISIPRYQGQLPVFYSKHSSSPRSYTDGNGVPLYAFGHGLSYSTFEYKNLSITPENPTAKDVITVTLDVTNTSSVDGTETIQLYVRDMIASVVTPVQALKGFSQVQLKAGETKTVSMKIIPEEHLWVINGDMKRVVEPGEFEFRIGSSSSNIKFREKIELK